jgi:hypothetical protein
VKILREGHLSIHDNSQWTPGQWREEPTAVPGDSCGVGLHSIICGDPLKSPVFCWPCEVWQDECEEELGHDDIKGRYKRQRITEDITSAFPAIIELNSFVRSVPKVSWFKPKDDTCPDWMRPQPYPTVAAARDAAWDAARDAAWDAARAAARDAAWDAARDAAWDAAGAAAWAAAWDAAWDAARAAARDAAWAAAGMARRILVSDLDVDTEWLWRWWRAWELGYYPIQEDGDTLVVGKIG